MKNFSKKQLIGSLFCPGICFLWGLFYFFETIINIGFIFFHTYRFTFIMGMLIGGVLSTVLSLAADIHTEDYLEKRLILIAVVFVFRQIILRFMVSSDMFYIVLFLILAGISYIVLFTKIRDENTDLGEMTVILLSDPELYWVISDTLMFAI